MLSSKNKWRYFCQVLPYGLPSDEVDIAVEPGILHFRVDVITHRLGVLVDRQCVHGDIDMVSYSIVNRLTN